MQRNKFINSSSDMAELSVVCTIYRAEGMVRELVRQIKEECEHIDADYEIILVDDRSPDASWNEILQICSENARVRGLRMARNVGQQIAISVTLRPQQQGDILREFPF